MRTFANHASPLQTLAASAILAVGVAVGALGYAGVTSETLLSSAHAQQETQAPQTPETQQPQEQPQEQPQAQQDQQNILVTMTHGTDDLHASLMALKLAKAMLDEGAKVTLFVNLEAVRLVDSRQPDNLSWGADGKSVGEHFRSVVDAGAKVMVCPQCADVVGLTPSSLRNGATMATLEQVAEAMLAADKVVDY
jgi:predicted peroxiredoxin